MLELFWNNLCFGLGFVLMFAILATPVATFVMALYISNEVDAYRYRDRWRWWQYLLLWAGALLLIVVEISFINAAVTTPGNLLYDIWEM